MSIRTTIKLLTGLVLVLAVTAGSTYLLGNRLAQSTSDSASIQIGSLEIGTDYPGTVEETFVTDGEQVSAGQELFTVSSLALQRDLREGTVATDSGGYTVDEDGTMTFLAPGDGVVSGLTARAGSFVPAGSVLTAIAQPETLYVLAQFDLTPREYARVEVGAAVGLSLPNAERLSGVVRSVSVTTNEGRAQAVVVIESDALAGSSPDGLFQPGTPVEASMSLRDEGPLAEVVQSIGDFGRKIGL
ncbi:HlyD family efflux transporter periplasmic adaptor subunit [Serinibacter arcticus]|nr:HlyD family efflux transporter periplasmic adaptor subunit [Serinibacter arcticus]